MLNEILGEKVTDGVSELSVKWMGEGVMGPVTTASRRYNVSSTVTHPEKSKSGIEN